MELSNSFFRLCWFQNTVFKISTSPYFRQLSQWIAQLFFTNTTSLVFPPLEFPQFWFMSVEGHKRLWYHVSATIWNTMETKWPLALVLGELDGWYAYNFLIQVQILNVTTIYKSPCQLENPKNKSLPLVFLYLNKHQT